MKPNVWKHSLILLAGLSVWAGCEPEKEEDVVEPIKPYVYDPNRILAENEIKEYIDEYEKLVFNYDSEGRLIEVDKTDPDDEDNYAIYTLTYEDEKLSSVKRVSYDVYNGTDENNNPTTRTYRYETTKNFFYNQKQLVDYTLETYQSYFNDTKQDNDSYTKTIYSYSALNELTKLTNQYGRSLETLKDESYQELSWGNGNLAEQKWFDLMDDGTAEMDEVREYSKFDNKFNPLSVLTVLDEFYIDDIRFASQHNPTFIKDLEADDNGTMTHYLDISIDITYDSQGRPTNWTYNIKDIEENETFTESARVTYK